MIHRIKRHIVGSTHSKLVVLCYEKVAWAYSPEAYGTSSKGFKLMTYGGNHATGTYPTSQVLVVLVRGLASGSLTNSLLRLDCCPFAAGLGQASGDEVECLRPSFHNAVQSNRVATFRTCP